jgi:hypothetical protein
MDQDTREYLICLAEQLKLIDQLLELNAKHDCYPNSFTQEEMDISDLLATNITQLNYIKPLLKHKFPELKHPALL